MKKILFVLVLLFLGIPRTNSGETCRSDICTDYGEDCCAPFGEPRGCKHGYYVKDDTTGKSGWEACRRSYGQGAIYKCCTNEGNGGNGSVLIIVFVVLGCVFIITYYCIYMSGINQHPSTVVASDCDTSHQSRRQSGHPSQRQAGHPSSHRSNSNNVPNVQLTALPSHVAQDDPDVFDALFCTNCGSPLNLGDKFCTNCGSRT